VFEALDAALDERAATDPDALADSATVLALHRQLARLRAFVASLDAGLGDTSTCETS
jgi:hypothetical protein